MAYYARNDEEREFDNTIRESIKKAKTKSHMALYLQGQEELSLLREMVDKQDTMEKKMDDIRDLVNAFVKNSVLFDPADDIKMETLELNKEAVKGVKDMNRKMSDLITYICETDDRHFEGGVQSANSRVHNDAIQAINIMGLKAKELWKANPECKQFRETAFVWDYILCCVEACRK